MTAPASESTSTQADEPDLTEFQEAAAAVLAADADAVADATNTARKAYRETGRKGMAAIRAYLSDESNRVILVEGDLDKAQKLIKLSQDILKPAPSKKKDQVQKTPKDITADYIEHVAAIQLGYSLSILEAPAALAEGWKEQVQVKADETAQEQARTYRIFLENKQEGEEPDVPEFVKAGARISLGRAPKGQGRKPKAVEEAAERDAVAAVQAEAAPVQAEAAAEPVAETPAADTSVTQETVDAYTQAVG